MTDDNGRGKKFFLPLFPYHLAGNHYLKLYIFSKAFCDLLGYPPKELKNKTWQELTPPDEIETIQKLRRDSDGKPINFITTIVDITERKRAEAEKEKLEAQLIQAQIFMSGYTANVIAHRGVLDEGVFFIQKPFSRKDIAVKLRELLDGC